MARWRLHWSVTAPCCTGRRSLEIRSVRAGRLVPVGILSALLRVVAALLAYLGRKGASLVVSGDEQRQQQRPAGNFVPLLVGSFCMQKG